MSCIDGRISNHDFTQSAVIMPQKIRRPSISRANSPVAGERTTTAATDYEVVTGTGAYEGATGTGRFDTVEEPWDKASLYDVTINLTRGGG
jgi:hypothetical protein